MREREDWIGQRSWTYVAKDVYTEAWETDAGDLLYVKDTLQGTRQSTFDDFQEPRYAVALDRHYTPSDEPTVLDRFWEEDGAAGLIRAVTYPGV